MYSSNSNPFNVCLPPSLFPHHSTLHEIFLQYPYNQFQEQPFSFPNEFFPVKTDVDPSPPFIIDNAAASNNAVVDHDQYPQCDPLGGNLMGDKESRAKKDRHSMIFTAQGLRHRRVRLSIDIAHKFFNLQDMLGFDKASQTLDWLFTNSKTAIQELVQINNHNLLPFYNSSSSTSDQLEILSQNKGAGTELINEGSRRIRNSKNKSTRALAVDHHIAKVSREKARERARERTREKQRIRKLDEELIEKRIPHHNRSISSSSEIVMPALPVNETQWKDIIVEAILTKKPLKSSPMYIYQQNMPVAPEEIKFQSQLFSQYY